MVRDEQTVSWLGNIGLALLMGVTLFVTYSPSLSFRQFVYDAGRVVEKQPVVTGDWSLPRLLRTDYWGRTRGQSIGSYRPFAVAQLWLEYKLWGAQPWKFAISQLLWMWLVCLLAVVFCRQVGMGAIPAWLVGFCFALHPVHTEIVANVAGRADLLMACLFLLGLWLHHSKQVWALPCNLVVVLLGMASKELFVVFPVAVFLLDWLGGQRSESSSQQTTDNGTKTPLASLSSLPWFSYLLYGAVVVLFVWMRHHMIGSSTQFPHGSHDNPLLNASLWTRFFQAPMLLWRNLEILVAPMALSPDRTFAAVPLVQSLADWRWWAGIVSLLIPGWLAWKQTQHAVVRVTLALAILLYLPISNTVVAGPIIMADRWLFLLSLPFCMALVMLGHFLFQHLTRLRWFLGGAGILYLLFCAVITYDYTWHWRSSLTLFQYASSTTPNSLKARFIHAQELLWSRQPNKALQEYRATLRIQPDFELGVFGMAEAYESMGQYKQAEELLRGEVRRAGLQNPNARIRLVLFLRRQKRWAEAQQVDHSIRRDFAHWLNMMKRTSAPKPMQP